MPLHGILPIHFIVYVKYPNLSKLFYIFKFEQINRSLDLRYHIGVKKRDIRFGFDTIFEHIKFDAKTVGLGIR